MSIKVRLENDSYLENAYVGFSWTIFFFGFWVPLFRKRNGMEWNRMEWN